MNNHPPPLSLPPRGAEMQLLRRGDRSAPTGDEQRGRPSGGGPSDFWFPGKFASRL